MTRSDNFNRDAEVPLSPPWISALAGGVDSNGSLAYITTGEQNVHTSLYDGVWGGNQWAQGTVGSLGAGAFAILCVRSTITTEPIGYEFHTNGLSGVGNTFIAMREVGGITAIRNIATTVANGDVMRFEVSLTTLSVYKNGSFVDSVVDTTYSSGQPGVGAYGAATVDDWSASDGEDRVRGNRMVGWKYSRVS